MFQRLKIEKPRLLQSYVDADYAGDLDQRRSYMAAVETSKEVLWLRGLVETFNIIQDSVRVHCDSQSAIHLTKDHMYHKWTKHIDV